MTCLKKPYLFLASRQDTSWRYQISHHTRPRWDSYRNWKVQFCLGGPNFSTQNPTVAWEVPKKTKKNPTLGKSLGATRRPRQDFSPKFCFLFFGDLSSNKIVFLWKSWDLPSKTRLFGMEGDMLVVPPRISTLSRPNYVGGGNRLQPGNLNQTMLSLRLTKEILISLTRWPIW